jgi:hypothetical protein
MSERAASSLSSDLAAVFTNEPDFISTTRPVLYFIEARPLFLFLRGPPSHSYLVRVRPSAVSQAYLPTPLALSLGLADERIAPLLRSPCCFAPRLVILGLVVSLFGRKSGMIGSYLSPPSPCDYQSFGSIAFVGPGRKFWQGRGRRRGLPLSFAESQGQKCCCSFSKTQQAPVDRCLAQRGLANWPACTFRRTVCAD